MAAQVRAAEPQHAARSRIGAARGWPGRHRGTAARRARACWRCTGCCRWQRQAVANVADEVDAWAFLMIGVDPASRRELPAAELEAPAGAWMRSRLSPARVSAALGQAACRQIRVRAGLRWGCPGPVSTGASTRWRLRLIRAKTSCQPPMPPALWGVSTTFLSVGSGLSGGSGSYEKTSRPPPGDPGCSSRPRSELPRRSCWPGCSGNRRSASSGRIRAPRTSARSPCCTARTSRRPTVEASRRAARTRRRRTPPGARRARL